MTMSGERGTAAGELAPDLPSRVGTSLDAQVATLVSIPAAAPQTATCHIQRGQGQAGPLSDGAIPPASTSSCSSSSPPVTSSPQQRGYQHRQSVASDTAPQPSLTTRGLAREQASGILPSTHSATSSPPLPDPLQRRVSASNSRSRAFRYRQGPANPPSPTASESPGLGLRSLAQRAASLTGLTSPVQPEAETPSFTQRPRGSLASARDRRQEHRRSGHWIVASPSGLRPIGLGLGTTTSTSGQTSGLHSRSSSISSNASRSDNVPSDTTKKQRRAATISIDTRSEVRPTSAFSSDSSVPTEAASPTRSSSSRPQSSVLGHNDRSCGSTAPSPTSSTSHSRVTSFSQHNQGNSDVSLLHLWNKRDSISSLASFKFPNLSSEPPTDSDDSDEKRDSVSSGARRLSLLVSPFQQLISKMPAKGSANAGSGRTNGKTEAQKEKPNGAAATAKAGKDVKDGTNKEKKRASSSTNESGSVGAAESEDSDGEGFEDAEGGAGEDRDGTQDDRGNKTEAEGNEDSANAAQEESKAGETEKSEPAAPIDSSVDNSSQASPRNTATSVTEVDSSIATEEQGARTPLTARPPPPPPRPSVTTAAPSTPTTRKNSAPSLWDRLKSPQERPNDTAATVGSTAGSASTPRLPQRQQSSGSIFNSLTSAANYAATSAASRGFTLPERLGGGPAAAASLAPTPSERKRLPVYEVDEGKMMEDQMRFAEARHLLATSNQLEQLRSLGKDLESGWREKLAEMTEMHLRLEDLTASVSDIQDENEQLRSQLSSLSEQIALREEDFEAFQRLTVAHQEREKDLWHAESKEEKERLEWKEREAIRILAEERAINAQLRLVLLGSLNGDSSGPSNPSGLITSSALLEKTASSDSAASGRSAVFDAGDGDSSIGEELERGNGPRDGGYSGSVAGGGEEGAIQDDVLFNLNLPHTASVNGSSPTPGGGGGGGGGGILSPTLAANRSAVSSLFSDVVPLDQLRLILKLPSPEEEEAAQRILSDAPPPPPPSILGQLSTTAASQMTPSISQTSNFSLASPSQQQQQQAAAYPFSHTFNAPPSQSVRTSHLQSFLVQSKSLADYQLSQSLQLENLSLRSQLRDEVKKAEKACGELSALKEKVRGMEEAIGGLLEGGGALSISGFSEGEGEGEGEGATVAAAAGEGGGGGMMTGKE